jgi:hypothetical protein
MNKIIVWGLISWSFSLSAQADVGNRLLATGGVSTIEGAAGGGLVPMAVLAGYGTQEEQGGVAFISQVNTDDYRLQVVGGSWSWSNRLEVSIAEQKLTHDSLSQALGLTDETIRQTIFGAKLRVAGDLIYTAMPQISIGMQYKKNHDFLIPGAVGARSDSGQDIYLSATKLILGAIAERNWLLNGSLRYTKANQLGLVGFGGDKNNSPEWFAELSTGIFINKNWLIGTEYRQKPNNLSAVKEDDWYSYFLAWFPNKQISVVAAYVDLGEIATFKNQTGWYLSSQVSF